MSNVALIFARHGNTFEADETPRYVGAGSDLPLTDEGERQAQAVATYLQQNYAALGEIIAGPLLRTRRTAEIVAHKFDQKICIDDRLREIHFGNWEGLTAAAIQSQFGDEMLHEWEHRSAFPPHMGWSPSRATLIEAMREFLMEQLRNLQVSKSSYLAVTSNGILRLVHEIVTGNPAGTEAKVKTGHLCILQPEGAGWQITAWNRKPA